MNRSEQSSLKAAIALDDLSIGYKHKPLFKPFSLKIESGTFNVIIGANGSGKSTLLQTITGNLEPVQGTVFIDSKDISSLNQKEKARMISLVYTERIISGGLTVKETVSMGRHPYTGLLGRLSQDDMQIVSNAMEQVGISHKADCFLSDISDGERQKAMIARALAQNTPVLMLDEPTNFLDVASKLSVFNLVRRLTDNHGITVLLSTHDTETALEMADNILTIIHADDTPVAINKAGSNEANERLFKVFADRNITFNPLDNTFRLK